MHCPSARGDLACAVGSVCVASGCATVAQSNACAGLDDNAPCSVDGIGGRCIGGACRNPQCGNGLVEGDEQCDDGNLISNDGCAANCASNETCGNNVTDCPAEQCDDGNTLDGDLCRSNCTIPRCGDGVIDVQNGEACDDGDANSTAPDACRTNCQLPRCGDHVTDTGETCDDGNLASEDGRRRSRRRRTRHV